MKPLATWLLLLFAAVPQAPAAERVAEVVGVRPSGDAVPENLLRISIVFDRPTGDAVLPRLRLVKADGAEIDRPFLDEELWSSDSKTLTVLFNPGRVKSGVGPNEQYGRALAAGENVRLVLDGRLIKSWRVGPPTNRGLDLALWKIVPPVAGSDSVLVVDFGRPIDALDTSFLMVATADGKPVPGKAELTHAETVWTFSPGRPWPSGHYLLFARGDLEDPCGNTPLAAFEMNGDGDLANHGPFVLPFSVVRAIQAYTGDRNVPFDRHR